MRLASGLCVACAALVLAATAPAADANDALRGTWRGTVGTSTVILKVDQVRGGALFGTYDFVGAAKYTLSDAPPNAANAEAKFEGSAVTIRTPGGLYRLQHAGSTLSGTYTSSFGRTFSASFSKQ